MQHVVHQHDVPILHLEGQVGGFHAGMDTDAGEVVAVEDDVERAERLGQAQFPVQVLGHPHAAGMDADHQRIGDAAGLERSAQAIGQIGQQGIDIEVFGHRGFP